jgi:cytochrome c553
MQGEALLDETNSRVTFINSCAGCHGKSGTRMVGVSIRYRDLSDPKQHAVPYTDSLFFRFLDDDLKSDGTKANIGVIWKLSEKDKQDLLAYLKTL